VASTRDNGKGANGASARKRSGAARKSGAKKASAAKAKGKPNRRRREDEVAAAAVKVFREHGYADASVQDVADELGILKGSLYHYIETKEDLLYRVLMELHEQVEEILERVAAEEGLAPLERLDLYVREQVEFNVQNLARVSIYYDDVDRLSDARRKEIFERRKVHERYVTGLIEEAQKNGEAASEVDPHILANCIFATVIWTYKWFRPGGKVNREKLASSVVQFVLDGVIGPVGANGGRKAKAKPKAKAKAKPRARARS
jgi:AcrR family transcriptional regulator